MTDERQSPSPPIISLSDKKIIGAGSCRHFSLPIYLFPQITTMFGLSKASLITLLLVWHKACAFTANGAAVSLTSSCREKTKFVTRRHMALAEEEEDDELGLKKIKIGDKDFWMRQKQLVQEMQDSSAANLKAEMKEKFSKRRIALVGDTVYIGFIIFCVLWTVSANPFVAFSYALGTTMGVAYSYGLGRYVESVGASVDDQGVAQGAGVGEARFAFLILLFIFVGKFRSQGLLEIPSIAGFFTYQLASLRQGLKEYND